MEKAVRALDRNTGFADPFAFDMKTENAGGYRHSTLLHYGEQGTSLFSVLWAMMKSDPSPARRAVVIFRDPWAHSPGFGGVYSEWVEDSHVRLISDAQHLWTSFHIVAIEEIKALPKQQTDIYAPTQTGVGGYDRVYDQNIEKARDRALNGGKDNLERLAADTGGRIWWNPKKNFSDAVAGIANELNSQFAVTYAVRSETGAGLKHLLTVKSLKPGLRISAVKAYYSRQATTADEAAPLPRLQRSPPAANDQTK